MRQLIRDLIPHAPELGLFVVPDIPADRLQNAIRDYAKDVDAPDVMALYDATFMKSAKDGALFTERLLVFQNHDLQTPQVVRYTDIVQVDTKKKLLGGKRIELKVNRGRATVDLEIDFSGRPDAADHVARFLAEAILVRGEGESALGGKASSQDNPDRRTDRDAVIAALDVLVDNDQLLPVDRERMLRAL